MCKRNKFVAFLMVLCMMLTMFGGISEKEAYASEVQAVTMQEKLDYLLERLPKDSNGEIYFTVNQKNCEPTRESGHGCTNCNNVEITKTKWFKDLFGEIDATCYPKHWYSDTGWNYNGNSCFGFACFCQWYLYADNREGNLTGEKVATIKFNKEDVQTHARPGDVLRIVNPETPYGHSVVVYSVEADGVWVVDSNWNRGSDLNCKVYKHFISYTLDYAKGRTTYVCRPSKSAQMESGMAGLFDMESYVKTEPTVLKYGDSGQQVQYFQQNLNFLGYSVGTADGEYGNLTKTAVSNLQTALHMDQTGTVKEGLYDLVYGVISEVQYYLKAKGYYTISVDGISGSGTQTAMKKLQKEWGTEQTGVLTVTLLERILSDTSVQISKVNIREYVGRMKGEFIEDTPTPEPSDPIEAFVTRMYRIILEREPDAGSSTWINGLKDGSMTGVRVADGFVLSEEMLNKEISNEEFVKILYRAFFGREADAEGLATWKNLLDAGCKKTYVFAGFANSAEFGNLCAEAGIVQGRAAEYLADRQTGLSEQDYKVWCFVERMYMEVLNRTADELGVRSWVSSLKDGSKTGVQVADGFIMSEEFLAKNMTNEEYVRIMYSAFFGRDADPEGLATWTNALATGWTKRDVFVGFANSNEFGVLCEEYGISRDEEEQEVTPVPERSEMIIFIESEDVPCYDNDLSSEDINDVYNRIVSSAMRFYSPAQDTVRLSENGIVELAERLLEVPGITYIEIQEITRLKNNSVYRLVLNGWVNVIYAYLTGDESVILEGSVTDELLVTAKEIMNIANEFSTQYEKERFIHDYLVENTEYGVSCMPADAYGALVEKKCVCAGFADAFQLLMSMAEIDCIYVSGEAFNGKERAGHAWNKVKIDDEWYNVDVTWDRGYPKYEYFNVTDEYLSINHFWDNTGLPVCNTER